MSSWMCIIGRTTTSVMCVASKAPAWGKSRAKSTTCQSLRFLKAPKNWGFTIARIIKFVKRPNVSCSCLRTPSRCPSTISSCTSSRRKLGWSLAFKVTQMRRRGREPAYMFKSIGLLNVSIRWKRQKNWRWQSSRVNNRSSKRKTFHRWRKRHRTRKKIARDSGNLTFQHLYSSSLLKHQCK